MRSVGQRFEVKPSVRALAFGFFRQKAAQRFQLLIDRKESVPKIVNRQGRAHLIGNGSEKRCEKLNLATLPSARSHSPCTGRKGGNTKT